MVLLEARRSIYLTRCQRAAVTMLLATTGTITADDIRSMVDLPPEVDARLIGAAIRRLSRIGIIRPVGIATSTRPERHAGILRTWKLAGREAAVTWLREHLDRLEPMPDDEKERRRQKMTLLGRVKIDEKSSTVAAAEPKQLTLFAGEQEHGKAQ
jgi:hypothetical protein